MKFVHKLGAIVWKDFVSEFRTKEIILSMCLFSFLVLIIFNFAFGSSLDNDRGMIAGILWVAFVFSGLTGLGRSFSMERDKGTLQGLILCPVSPWTIFLAKLIGVFLFTAVMEIIIIGIKKAATLEIPSQVSYAIGSHPTNRTGNAAKWGKINVNNKIIKENALCSRRISQVIPRIDI